MGHQLKMKALVRTLFVSMALSGLAGCGGGEDSNGREPVDASMLESIVAAAPTHQICGNYVNVRDSNLRVIGTAQSGAKISLTGEVKTGTGTLAGNTFRRVYFYDAPKGYGWVATQFICSLSNPPATGRVIEVNVATNRLKFFRNGQLVREWNVGTARSGYTTPRGTFKVRIKQVCPPYYGDGSQNIPGCRSNNPLGSRALWWQDTIYGLHGTNQPALIAEGTTANQRRVSSGCVRNLNANIEWLYDQVQVGDTIIVK